MDGSAVVVVVVAAEGAWARGRARGGAEGWKGGRR